MAGRHATSAAACAVIASTWCGVARAQSPSPAPSPIQVVWTAPEGCPQRAVVEAEIARLLGAPPRAEGGRRLDVDGTVTGTGAGYSLELSTRDGEGATGQRTIAGASCEALASAAALVVALGWDPEAVAATRAAPPVAAAQPAPVPPTPPPPAAPILPPPPISQPGASPASPSRGPGSLPPPPRRPRDRDPVVELGLSFALDAGGLPGVTPGIEGGGALLLGPWRIGARLTAFPRSEATLEGDASRGGDFSQVFGLASLGRALLPWTGGRMSHELSAHIGLEAGATFAAGFGVDNENQETVPWVAPRLEAGGRIGLPGGLGLRGSAGAAIPVDPRAFLLDDLGELHAISPLVGRFTAGLDVRF